ncbi:hypothetical protein [Halorubellus salinus]|uniref:hypothetical protein n=1 Tax=Halorubellus salinus TaxID=755309 RepID=UPI001D077F00|nr:hypothetical protein [Halorubellus salinus]
MVTLLGGLVGGLVATIAMTMAMMALGDGSPPPTAALWAKFVGDEPPEAYVPQGMALHVLYGVGAGGAFALALPALGFGSAGVVTVLGLAIAYALALTLVGAAFWMNVVLATDPEPQQAAMFGVFHVVYGVVLAAVVAYAPL